MNNNEIKPLCVKEMFAQDKYRIPVYQRNYDWGEAEAIQLLQDIADYVQNNPDRNYYIGTLVVFPRKNEDQSYWETIDGQQRITTLTLLLCVLRNEDDIKNKIDWFKNINLSYDYREEANDAIQLLFDGKKSEHQSAANLNDVYSRIKSQIRNVIEEREISLDQFVDYLLEKVIIMRVVLPQDTELNHYFEIMNSRGEQLEKHEILKARLMNNISNDKQAQQVFNLIWEACSDMNTYVQMKFPPKLRNEIFPNSWTEFLSITFDDLKLKFSTADVNDPKNINDLLQESANANNRYTSPDSDEISEGEDRFGSVVNFPNFLLHVLKIMYNVDLKVNNEEDDNDVNKIIRLDDKRLVEIFDSIVEKYNKEDFSKKLIITLLNIRFLFDRYVIKSENSNTTSRLWCLKTIKNYNNQNKPVYLNTFSKKEDEDDDNDGNEIRMLQAMFHVSSPSPINKYWLNALLYFLYKNRENINAHSLQKYLFSLARNYMSDRYLANNKTKFDTIIYNNNFQKNNNLNFKLLDKGCKVETFVFNFFDYLLWKENDRQSKDFEFTFRNSVEHFYPQEPKNGDRLENLDDLNSFGNLCLISREINSKFNNDMPLAKYENYYKNDKEIKKMSLKLISMMEIVQESGWNVPQIKAEEAKAKNLIRKYLE